MNTNNESNVESLALRIRQLRIAMGLTQRQLGGQIGVSATAVGKWETGEYHPKGRYVTKLAEVLGIDLEELLGESSRSVDVLSDEVQLLAAFRALSKDRQLIAIKLVEALK